MSWYQCITSASNKLHYFQNEAEFEIQNTEPASCGLIWFGQDIEKISNPNPHEMCSRCYARLAKYNKNFEGRY
jgi:hypothetical protein